MTLLISEVFGPTVQGEGPNTGKRCAFIRLGLCNLDCGWCDTPYTWDWTRYDRHHELHSEEALGIVEAEIVPMGVDRVVITGGEPLVQRHQLEPLVRLLRANDYTVEVETNGTILPTEELLRLVSYWNVSPKLAHSGVSYAKRYKPDVLRDLMDTGHAAFKFVCQGRADLYEIAEIQVAVGLPSSMIWVMPEGRDPLTLRSHMAEITDQAIQRGYNITGRLHVEIWGDARAH